MYNPFTTNYALIAQTENDFTQTNSVKSKNLRFLSRQPVRPWSLNFLEQVSRFYFIGNLTCKLIIGLPPSSPLTSITTTACVR